MATDRDVGSRDQDSPPRAVGRPMACQTFMSQYGGHLFPGDAHGLPSKSTRCSTQTAVVLMGTVLQFALRSVGKSPSTCSRGCAPRSCAQTRWSNGGHRDLTLLLPQIKESYFLTTGAWTERSADWRYGQAGSSESVQPACLSRTEPGRGTVAAWDRAPSSQSRQTTTRGRCHDTFPRHLSITPRVALSISPSLVSRLFITSGMSQVQPWNFNY